MKREVTKRASDCCEYCRSQARFSMQPFSIEHIVPRRRGGPTMLDNLALSCQGCNGYKSIKVEGPDPATGALTPLFNPRQQRWQDHFTWNEEYTQILGITEIGRATIELLQMNRSGLVNLRAALFALGDHPHAAHDRADLT
jgi:hypothetical protein